MMNMSELTQTNIDKIIDKAKATIPSPTEIFEQAVSRITVGHLETDYVKANFSQLVVELEKIAYSIYLDYEKKAIEPVIERWYAENREIITRTQEQQNEKSAKAIASLFWPVAKRMEFRLGQMRKSRAGKTFELIIETLLRKASAKCEKPKGAKARKTLKRIDLVIPDQKTALERPDQAFFISCKRTLRERWKQTIPERKPSWRVFLITADDELSEETAKDIDQLGMIAYVRDELKAKSHLKSAEWVRRLSDLARDLGLQ
jgi:hypothetical protein